MPKGRIFFAAFAFCAFFLFVAGVQKIAADCAPSCDGFSLESGCNIYNDSNILGKCHATVYNCQTWGGQTCTKHVLDSVKCQAWQSPFSWTSAYSGNDDACHTINGFICGCDKNCLLKQDPPLYYDQPTITSGTKQQGNAEADGSYSNVTLPVLLTWHDPNNVHGGSKAELSNRDDKCWPKNYPENSGDNTDCARNDSGPESWLQIPPYGTQAWIVDFLVNYNADEKDASKRLIRFDPKEPPDPNNLTPPNSEGKLVDGVGPSGATARLLEFVTDKTNFNSRDNGWPCFFNSDSTIYWRVRPCCEKKDKVYLPGQAKNDDSTCLPETSPNAQWWKFKTSPAPEPLGVTDKTHSTPAPDPDWAGTSSLTDVDFCTAGLHWCSAKVAPEDDKAVFQQNIGHNQALAYEMAVDYNEDFTLKSALGSQYDQLVNNPLIGIVINAAERVGSSIFGSQKTCHYLLYDQTTKVCRAEIVEPHGAIAKIPATDFSNSTDQNFNRGFFTKKLQYDWTLKRCFDNSNAGDEACQQNIVKNDVPIKDQKNYGQTWSFRTVENYTLPAPLLSSPPHDTKATDQNASTPVGIPPTIAWKPQCGANSFEYELSVIDPETGAVTPLLTTQKTVSSQVTFVKSASAANAAAATTKNEDVKTDVRLDTAYKWRVRSCWPSVAVQNASQLCDDKSWTDWFSFRTTGRPPQNLKAVGNNASNIPTTFSWDPVGGAQSYVLELTDGQLTAPLDKLVKSSDATKPASIQLLYPDLKPSPAKAYKWQVKTCADDAGSADLCGAWSPKYSFSTLNLPAPQGLVSPKDMATLDNYPAHLSWNSVNGALAYRVMMDYTNQDTNSECPKSGQLFNSTATNNGFDPPGLALACLGNYTWSVASCFSTDCKPDETGTPAKFTFSINKAGGKASGFMVCGLRDDDPKTDWDERKPCQAADLFKVLEKLIDFVMFKLSFWLLPVLAVITGGLFFAPAWDVIGKDNKLVSAGTIRRVKTMWKYIGIGYALLFFAWLLTTWALQSIFGYTGLWWKIL